MNRTIILRIAGILMGLGTAVAMQLNGNPAPISKMAGIAVLMAFWWITEAVNIYFTALLPIILYPFLGIMGIKEVAPTYMNKTIFLFIGGFLIAFAMEKCNLHKRIALTIILRLGNSPSRILLGFMLASFLLSMWILNTATVMMLLPAVLAIAEQLNQNTEAGKDFLSKPLLLGIAYAASIGGTATLIGTAPNLQLNQFLDDHVDSHSSLSFADWFKMGLPIATLCFTACFFILKRKFFRNAPTSELSIESCKEELRSMGKMNYQQKSVGITFLVTILLWFFRKTLDLGFVTIKGWTEWGLFDNPSFIDDGVIAMTAATALFLIPSRTSEKGGLITWQDFIRLPWGLIFLFGGGFVLAKGISSTGLGETLASIFTSLTDWSPVVVISLLCLFMTFFTELTSNTASIVLMLPILNSLNTHLQTHPYLLMIPVTLCASFAFMLPVATPPNTIVFGSERLKISDMTGVGLVLNLVCVVIVILATMTLIPWALGI